MRSLLLMVLGTCSLLAAEGTPVVWDGHQPCSVSLAGTILHEGGTAVLPVVVTGAGDGVRLQVTLVTATGPRQGVVTVQGDGRRHLHLPWRSLDAVSSATTSQAVLRVEGTPPAGFRVDVDPGWVTERAQGPAMTEGELFQRLDFTLPGLEAVRAAVARGDTAQARKILAAHLRQRPQRYRFPPVRDPAAMRRHADRVLAGDIRWIGLQRTFPEGRIEWLANHSLGTPSATHEWVWALNRHADLRVLAEAYQATGDERYAEAWVRLTRSWILEAPPPALADERPGSVWRTLDTGLRMSGAWFTGFYAVRTSPAFTDDDLVLFLRSVGDHGDLLARAPYNPSNHVVLGMSGLGIAGALFPEFREAAAWRRHAGQTLERLLAEGTLADGCWYEMSPGYGQWLCDHLVGLWNTLELAGADAELGAGFRTRLQALAEWGVQVMAPDRSAPMVNDGVRLVYRPSTVALMSERFPASDLLRWLRDDVGGARVEAPVPPSRNLEPSGHLVLRTDWSRSGTFVLLDAGPFGGWHGHQDGLNLVGWFHGREFLFDNGGYKYDGSRWRQWSPTTAAHNTVLVDGLGQARSWDGDRDPGHHPRDQPPTRFATSPAVDWMAGWYVSGYAAEDPTWGRRSNQRKDLPAIHHRAVVLVKEPSRGPLALVLDTLIPGDDQEHTYEARWHLKSHRWATADGGRITWTTDPQQPNLAVVAVSGTSTWLADSAVREPELLGWWIEHQNADPTPALTLRQRVSAKGVQRLLTALVPFTEDPAQPPIRSIRATGPEAWIIERPGREPLGVRLTASPADGPALEIDGLPLPTSTTP